MMQQACERCWKRKQRCDRQLPQCAVCKQANATCLPRRQGVVYNPQEPETWSFVESLRHRVARLEQAAADVQLGRHASHIDGAPTGETSPDHSSSDSDAAPDTTDNEAVRNDADPAVLSYALQQAARLPLNAMGEPHLEEPAISLVQSFTLESIFQAARKVSSDQPRSAKCTALESHSLQVSRRFQEVLGSPHSPATRQDQDLIKDALHRCGQYLAGFLPFTDAAALESMRISLYQEQIGQDETSLHVHALVDLATAIGLMQYPSARDYEPIAARFAERGTSLMPKLLSSDAAEIPVLQCFLALTVITTLLPRFGSTWHIFGLTVSRYVASGLHTESLRGRAESTSDTNEACTVECLYLFDTLIGVALDRPFALGGVDIALLEHSESRSAGHGLPLLGHMQFSNLLHEIRESAPDLGFEYHAFNWRHWKMSMSGALAVDQDSPAQEIRDRHLGRQSCQLLLSLLVSAQQNLWPAASVNPWITIIWDEFQAYVATVSRAVLEDGHALSSFDICDIFNIAIAAVELKARLKARHHAASQEQSSVACDSVAQTCVRLLSVGGMRFTFGHRLCDLLIEYLQLISSSDRGNSAKLCEDLLDRHHELVGTRIARYMMALIK